MCQPAVTACKLKLRNERFKCPILHMIKSNPRKAGGHTGAAPKLPLISRVFVVEKHSHPDQTTRFDGQRFKKHCESSPQIKASAHPSLRRISFFRLY